MILIVTASNCLFKSVNCVHHQVNIESCDVEGLLKVLRGSSHSLGTSIKFGMFMKSLISGYPHVVRSVRKMILSSVCKNSK